MNDFSPGRLVQDWWGIEAVDSQRILGGVSTENWMVATPDKRYVLRNAGRFGEYAVMQTAILEHLHDARFTYDIPRPERTLAGGMVHRVGENFFMVYPYIEGATGVNRNYSYKEFGAALGSCHHHLRNFDWTRFGQNRSKQLIDLASIDPYITALEDNVRNAPILQDELKRRYGSIEQVSKDAALVVRDLGRIGLEGYSVQVCHGDFTPANVLHTDGKISGLIDFGGVTIDPKVTDVATSLSRTAVKGWGYDSVIAGDLLEGYSWNSWLDDNEMTALAPLAFVDVIRSLSWQTTELRFNESTRVTHEDATEYMHKAAVLRDIVGGQV